MTLEDELHQQPKRIKTAQSSEASEKSQTVPTLLSELIFEILTRLPVDSLLRCKSVCKLWCSLISDPHFIKLHLYLSSNRNNHANHRLIISTWPRINFKTCNPYNVLYDQSIDAIELHYPLKHSKKSVWMVGSCNGLLCILVENDTLFIWNPSTRRSNMLPKCASKLLPRWYGFGYDKLSDDYKVVGISSLFKTEHDTEVKIYSLKRGNWKKIGDLPHGILFGDDGTFSNGALHWAVRRYFNSSYLWTIVSVGLGNESYGEVPQPVYDEGDKDSIHLTLGVLDEKLCVVCDYRGKCADVWVMKVYGVQDSWSKLVSVPYLSDPDPFGYEYSVPLCVSNDGKVLLQFGLKLYVYDSKNSLLLEIQNFDKCLETYTIVESLVSPDSPLGPWRQLC